MKGYKQENVVLGFKHMFGAGISGHIASSYIPRKLGKVHEVIVVSPDEYYQWIRSNIWVQTG